MLVAILANFIIEAFKPPKKGMTCWILMDFHAPILEAACNRWRFGGFAFLLLYHTGL
jgi:hypothetical protein